MRRNIFLFLLFLVLGVCNADAVGRHALIFGLGKQKDTSWGKINGDKDVLYVEKMLKAMKFTDVRSLVNEKATKSEMVKAFHELAGRCKKGDIVYVHYSGHGQLMSDLDGDESKKWQGKSYSQWDESWVPYDAYMNYCDKDRGEKHLSDDEIAVLLAEIRSKIGVNGQMTVVVDACHSGDATCGEEEECVRGVDVKFIIPAKTTAKKESTPVKENWLTISACKPFQLAMEMKNIQVGKLTYALFSLGSKAFSMTNAELEKSLVNYMEINKGRMPQTPVVSGKK